MSRPDFKPSTPSARLPYAKISAWCIQHLNNAQRLVVEGIFCELAVGESAIATSAAIARWANVSEATVSRALPGLAAKGLISLSRAYYSETGRTRWRICPLPAQPNGTYVPPGSDMDVSPALGSDVDVSPISAVSGIKTPESARSADSASGRLTSMTDPTIIYDSDSPNKQASKLASANAEEPHSRTRTAAPAPAPTSETPTVPAAFTDLCQRGVLAHSATQILKHHPTMTGAEFDRLLDVVVNTRKAADPLRYLCGILQRGEMLDPPPQRMALPPRRKVSNAPIIFAPVDGTTIDHYCKIFALARNDDERLSVLERFEREVVAPARAAADQAKEAAEC